MEKVVVPKVNIANANVCNCLSIKFTAFNEQQINTFINKEWGGCNYFCVFSTALFKQILLQLDLWNKGLQWLSSNLLIYLFIYLLIKSLYRMVVSVYIYIYIYKCMYIYVYIFIYIYIHIYIYKYKFTAFQTTPVTKETNKRLNLNILISNFKQQVSRRN